MSDNYLYSTVKPGVCDSSGPKVLLDNGVSLEYISTVVESGQQFTTTIGSKDCDSSQ